MTEAGTLPGAPAPTGFITDEYMKKVADDPKLKAFATELARTRNDLPGAQLQPIAALGSMTIEYLKRATKTPETETGNAREVVAEMLAEIETAARRPCASTRGSSTAGAARSWSRPTRSSAARTMSRRRSRGHRVRDRARAPLRAGAARVDPRVRGRDAAGADRRAAARAGQRRRLLCADRPLCAHRLGLHEHRDREGGRRARPSSRARRRTRARASIRTCSTR